MPQLFSNNAVGVLQNAITNTSTSLTLQTSQGDLFPTITDSSDYFLVTLYYKVNGTEYNHEIVKVTARSGDTFTIVRAQEGTVARNWAAGIPVECRVTAASLARNAIDAALFAPIPKTISATTYTVLPSDSSLIFTNANCTVTLPTPASNVGRILFIRNNNVNTDYLITQETSIISASNNVLGMYSTTLTNVILAASMAKFAVLQSDGTKWIVLAGN